MAVLRTPPHPSLPQEDGCRATAGARGRGQWLKGEARQGEKRGLTRPAGGKSCPSAHKPVVETSICACPGQRKERDGKRRWCGVRTRARAEGRKRREGVVVGVYRRVLVRDMTRCKAAPSWKHKRQSRQLGTGADHPHSISNGGSRPRRLQQKSPDLRGVGRAGEGRELPSITGHYSRGRRRDGRGRETQERG
jgi:hypothetical protein